MFRMSRVGEDRLQSAVHSTNAWIVGSEMRLVGTRSASQTWDAGLGGAVNKRFLSTGEFAGENGGATSTLAVEHGPPRSLSSNRRERVMGKTCGMLGIQIERTGGCCCQ